MVVRHRKVIHRTNHDLTILGNRPILRGVDAQNCRLRRIDDWGREHRAENSTIRDREGSAGELFNGDLPVSRLRPVFSDLFLDICKRHLIGITQNRNNKASRRAHRNTDIKVAVIHNIVAINGGVEHRIFLKSSNSRLNEKRHKPKLDAVLFFESLTILLTQPHERSHVDLVKGSKNCIARLGL